MATRSNAKKQKRRKRPPKKQEPMSDAEREDLELAEEILRVGREDQAVFAAGFDKLLKQLGITEKPIGAKKLREQMIKDGFDPNSNEFSKGIIDMREE